MELSKEDFEFLKQEVDKPPKCNERLKEALKRPLVFDSKKLGERDLSGIFCPYCGLYQDKDSSFKGINEVLKAVE